MSVANAIETRHASLKTLLAIIAFEFRRGKNPMLRSVSGRFAGKDEVSLSCEAVELD
jgi:hypothetical protein